MKEFSWLKGVRGIDFLRMGKASANFPRRRNANGSWDAICPVCYLTAATAETQAGLAQGVGNHVCKGR